jgi:FkbM family methyltransferase
VGSSGIVFAIEPVPQTFDLLKSNLQKWKVENVQPLPYAISDTCAKVAMEIPNYRSGGVNYYGAKITIPPSIKTQRTTSVQTDTLDSICFKNLRKIDFIKMDAMGNELKCIRGARRLIAEYQPAWLIAMYSDPNNPKSEASELFRILTDKGKYNIFWYDGKVLKPWKRGEKSYRYFFLALEHTQRLKERGWDLGMQHGC